MKNRQYSQFALLAMANRKHNEHRHIRSAIRELLAAELDLMNDGNGTGIGHLTVMRIHEALAELRGIEEQIQNETRLSLTKLRRFEQSTALGSKPHGSAFVR